MQKNIQKAIIFSTEPNYKKIKEKYNIIYLGSEFCQNLIPSEQEVKKVVDIGFKKVVLFIPFLTEERFNQYKNLISKLAKNYEKKIEISTSDIGIIYFLNKRFPKIPKNISRPLSIEFVRMKDEILKETIKELKINAIETDEEIFIQKLTKNKINTHFHMKLAFVALQRHCAFTGKITTNCNKICIGKELKLTIPQTNHMIVTRNNVYLKEINPKNYKNVKRLIYWI